MKIKVFVTVLFKNIQKCTNFKQLLLQYAYF